MTLNSEEKLISNSISFWSKIRKVLFYGIGFYVIGFLLVLANRYVRQETFSVSDAVFTFMYFFVLGAYLGLIEVEKCAEKIFLVLSRRWRKVAGTLRWWFYVLFAWLVLFLIRVLLLPQVLKIDFSLFDVFLIYMVFILSFSSCIYSLTTYIPCGKYLASAQVKIEEKKKVADALTVLTPSLGFPWILAIYLVLSLARIQVEPYWIIYVLFISAYVACFNVFIDLPYSVSIKKEKEQELDRLEKKRTALLENLQKVGDDKTEDILKKIAFESEIARIDREKQEIESKSIHPYKLVIPLASFTLGIFGALFIDFIKKLFQIFL